MLKFSLGLQMTHSKIIYTLFQMHNTEFQNNFPRFACLVYLILSQFQNQFFTFSEQLGQKFEAGLLFNTKMPAPFRVRDFVLVRGTDKGSI